MSGSSFGKIFRITTWGESHGPGIGVVIDGCPAGLALCEDHIQKFLDRRKPGQSKYTTKRNEADSVEILSVYSRVKPPGLLSLFSFAIRISAPAITAILQSCSRPDMPIILLQKNTGSGITGEAAAPPAERRSDVLRQVPSLHLS